LKPTIFKGFKNKCSFIKATFSPDGQKILSASDEDFINVWNARSGILVQNISDKTEA